MGIRIARGAALALCALAAAAPARADSDFVCIGLSGTPFHVIARDQTKTIVAPDNIQNAGPITSWGSDKVVWGTDAHVYTLDRQNPGLHLDYANRVGTGRGEYDFKCTKG